MDFFNVFTFELPGAACPVGQHHLPHRDVRARGVRGALELSHGGLDARVQAPLAGAASYSLEGDVGEQSARLAVSFLAREGTICKNNNNK